MNRKHVLIAALIILIAGIYGAFFNLPPVHGAESHTATIIRADYYHNTMIATLDTGISVYIDCARYDLESPEEDYFPAVNTLVTLTSDVISYNGEYGYTECMYDVMPSTITINAANILWEGSMGYIRYDDSKYAYVECNGSIVESDLKGMYPLFNVVYRDGKMVNAHITTDTDVTCMIEPEYDTTSVLSIVVRYADGNTVYASGSPLDAVKYAVDTNVIDLYTYVPTVVYLPVTMN